MYNVEKAESEAITIRIYNFTPDTAIAGKRVIALGIFDGVHLGHRKIIERAIYEARKLSVSAAVFTFIKESRLKDGEHIYDDTIKLEIFEKLGIDEVILTNFSDIGNISAEDFAEVILPIRFGCVMTVTGEDFKFGKGAVGNFSLLSEAMERSGGSAVYIPEVKSGGERISTSRIKKLLVEGQVAQASKLLGGTYFAKGKVIHGLGLGKTFGFPTVNTDIEIGECELKNGVYKTEIAIANKRYPSLTNVGVCPTVGERKKHRETYILGSDINVYDEEVKIYFLDFLREEKAFSSVEELKMQIKADIYAAFGTEINY